jgi:hypothetical protein
MDTDSISVRLGTEYLAESAESAERLTPEPKQEGLDRINRMYRIKSRPSLVLPFPNPVQPFAAKERKEHIDRSLCCLFALRSLCSFAAIWCFVAVGRAGSLREITLGDSRYSWLQTCGRPNPRKGGENGKGMLPFGKTAEEWLSRE